jgi:2-hydroxy-3-oxopropionate reductase
MNENSKPRIGFIGLGLMGSAMVERLQDCGYPVTVVAHRNRAPVDAAVGRGAVEAATTGELAAASDIVMLCVDTSDAVEAIMLGDAGVIAHLEPGTVVIDFGTSIPTSTLKLAEQVQARGASMMDAPLGKTPAQAKLGLLNIMAAGSDEDFARVQNVLSDLAENLFHVGPLGTGHKLKLLNNFIAQTYIAAVAQAFALGDEIGVPRAVLKDVVNSGPVGCGLMNFVSAYALEGDPNMLAFSTANARKDVGYYVRMAEDAGFNSMIGEATVATLDKAIQAGFGERNVPEVVDYFTAELAD